MRATSARGHRTAACRWSFESRVFTLRRGMLAVSTIHGSEYAFSKAKALMGTIGPVARARVNALWSENPDWACSPAARAPSP